MPQESSDYDNNQVQISLFNFSKQQLSEKGAGSIRAIERFPQVIWERKERCVYTTEKRTVDVTSKRQMQISLLIQLTNTFIISFSR